MRWRLVRNKSMGYLLLVWLIHVSGGENGPGELLACQVSSREEQLDAGMPVSLLPPQRGMVTANSYVDQLSPGTIEGQIPGNQVVVLHTPEHCSYLCICLSWSVHLCVCVCV